MAKFKPHPYVRIVKASERLQGVRLSADEVGWMATVDDAISTAANDRVCHSCKDLHDWWKCDHVDWSDKMWQELPETENDER